MKIGIASDHRGISLKQKLIFHFRGKVEKLVDYGTNSEESVDYPLYAQVVADKVVAKEIDFGILICGTGIGMCIAANKVKGARCANIIDEEQATLSRAHNNANVISINQNMPPEAAIKIVEKFINTPFSNEERHIRRLQEIENIEKRA